MAEFHTRFWVVADAVVSAESISEAWERLEQICRNARNGSLPMSGSFYSGTMTVVPDGAHLQQPVEMTQKVEDRLAVMYHEKVMKQGEALESEQISDHVYSMMIGFALAHDLRPEDARKLAHRLYYGQHDRRHQHQDQQEGKKSG